MRQEDASETEEKCLQNCDQTSYGDGAETSSTTKGQEARLEVNEMRTLMSIYSRSQ